LAWIRPISHTVEVGATTRVTPSGSSPDQPGPVTANAPAPLPVVRVPGEANTSVQADTIGIR